MITWPFAEMLAASACDNAVMRTSPLIGHKAWFGPRRLGWGLEPVSREGWLATLAFGALTLLLKRNTYGSRSRWIGYAMGAAFLLFAFLKGSAPGGAGARADFDAAKTSPVTN
jgi:hypothetical protein